MGLKSLASKGAKLAGSILGGKNYCTNVLNDFGFVQKAFFQVYQIDKEYTPKGNSKRYLDRKFKYKEQFPVQINPAEISIKAGSDRLYQRKVEDRITKTASLDGIDLIDTRGSFEPGETSIGLDYNIYDEYNAITSNGAISMGSGSDISLHSGSHTSLDKLREYAGLPDYYVLFRWGEIHVFGFLRDVDIDYKTFSCWGQPLVAHASVTILHQPLAFDDEGKEMDPCDCGQLKSGENAAKELDSTATKTMQRLYQGINALR